MLTRYPDRPIAGDPTSPCTCTPSFMGGGRGGVAPFLVGIVDYWPGDEASGPMLGGVNALDLAAVNGPTTMAGPGAGPSARAFTASQVIQTPDSDDIDLGGGGSFTVVCWAYATNLAAYPNVFGKGGPHFSTAGQDGYGLNMRVGGDAWWRTNNGTSHVYVAAGAGYAVQDAWQLWRCWYDADAGEIGFQAYGKAAKTASSPAGVAASTAGFQVADAKGSGVSGYHLIGGVGGLLKTRRLLTDAMWDFLGSDGRIRTTAELLAYRE